VFRVRALSRIYLAVFLIVGITLVGTLGFMLVEGYNASDALYMTIITVSTVGYGEVKPLSEGGRLFTSVLIIFTFGTFAYTLSSVTTFIMGGEYKNYFNRLRLEKQIQQLKGHTIICGYGRVGKMASRSLSEHNEAHVIIEVGEEKLAKLEDDESALYVNGDATADSVLQEAGIDRASAIICTMPDDAQNLYTVLTAREMNKKLTIITRASKRESVKKLRIAGANNVIMPDSVGGAHMASLVVNPDVQEFLDQIAIQGAAEVNLEEVVMKDVPNSLKGKNLKSILAECELEVNVIGLKNAIGEFIINPDLDAPLVKDSKFFVLGKPQQIGSFGRILEASVSL